MPGIFVELTVDELKDLDEDGFILVEAIFAQRKDKLRYYTKNCLADKESGKK